MSASRSERASVRMALVAMVVGAVAAGSVSLAAPPRLTPGTALASSAVLADLALTSADAAASPPADGAPPAHGASPAPAATDPSSRTAPTTTTTTTDAAPTTTVPPPTTTEAPSVRATGGPQQRVVELVNAERREAGCRPLRIDQRLVTAAQGHSSDMASNDYFSHTSRDGRSFADRIRAAGYPRPGAENIARGYRSADRVVRAWMSSDGHRANILNCGLVAIGVGLDTGGWFWTQDFGR